MTLAYFLLSCFQGIRECFIPFSPRKSIAWLSTILLMIVRNAFQNKPIRVVHYKPILGTESPRKTYRSIFENKNMISKCNKVLHLVPRYSWLHLISFQLCRLQVSLLPCKNSILPKVVHAWFYPRWGPMSAFCPRTGTSKNGSRTSWRLRTKTGHPVQSRGDHHGHACIYRTIESQALKSNRKTI